MNLPNILSISRIVLLLPIILLFEYGLYLISAGVFLIASVTDYLDGYFARLNNSSSESGALLDLLADKIFVSTLLIWSTFNFDSILFWYLQFYNFQRNLTSYLRLFVISLSKK